MGVARQGVAIPVLVPEELDMDTVWTQAVRWGLLVGGDSHGSDHF